MRALPFSDNALTSLSLLFWTMFSQQNCITFASSPSATLENKFDDHQLISHSSGGDSVRTLNNADSYVQNLWMELQMRLWGSEYLQALGSRIALAQAVMNELVTFKMTTISSTTSMPYFSDPSANIGEDDVHRSVCV